MKDGVHLTVRSTGYFGVTHACCRPATVRLGLDSG